MKNNYDSKLIENKKKPIQFKLKRICFKPHTCFVHRNHLYTESQLMEAEAASIVLGSKLFIDLGLR